MVLMRVAPGGEHNILEKYQNPGHSVGYLGFTTVQIWGDEEGGYYYCGYFSYIIKLLIFI